MGARPICPFFYIGSEERGGGLWQFWEFNAAMRLTAGSTRRTHRHGEAAAPHSHSSPLIASSLVGPVRLVLGIIGLSVLVEQVCFNYQRDGLVTGKGYVGTIELSTHFDSSCILLTLFGSRILSKWWKQAPWLPVRIHSRDVILKLNEWLIMSHDSVMAKWAHFHGLLVLNWIQLAT